MAPLTGISEFALGAVAEPRLVDRVTDLAEAVGSLTTKEGHGTDTNDGDQGDQKGVLNQ